MSGKYKADLDLLHADSDVMVPVGGKQLLLKKYTNLKTTGSHAALDYGVGSSKVQMSSLVAAA